MDRRARRRQTIRRRRAVAAVALTLALLVVFGLAGACGSEDDENLTRAEQASPAPPRPRPSLDRQIGELMMVSFQGSSAPGYVRDALRAGRISGVVLFGRNVVSEPQVRAMTRELQAAARGRALIATDQEGGEARTLSFAAPAVAQSALPTPRAAAASARQSARDVRAAGLNVVLAPVADVGDAGGALSFRAYPGGARGASASVRAAVRAFAPQRVAPTLKHFPGLGLASANTDDSGVTIPSSREEIEQRDLPPFRAGIEAGAPLVMISHALYPGLDRRNIASQSRPILVDLLRDRLGFRGVVVTDSIEAAGVLERSSLERGAVRSVAAGADVILMTGPGSFPRVRRALTREARRSPAFRRRVEESAARVRVLRDRLAGR